MKSGMAGHPEGIGDVRAGGDLLRAGVVSAHAALEARAAEIDALNVYPVPDGDTGTNMLLTVRSVLREVSARPGLAGVEAARAVSRAALMGARGNSGVILSQIVRGACEVLGEAKALHPGTVAAALERARERAYAAMGMPVEGTMLTVLKDAAAGAGAVVAAKGGKDDALEVLRTAAEAAHASVKRTPELLGALREAGVVDAGGLGLAVILDGLVAALKGEEPGVVRGVEDRSGGSTGPGFVPDRLHEVVAHSAAEAWGYCTEFLVSGFEGDAAGFGRSIHDMGKSVLVVSDDDLVKVHLHTQDPGAALSYAGGFGRLHDVKVDDMEAQTKARAGMQARNAGSRPKTSRVGVVAASQGSGVRAFFEGMGAVVVEGGQGMNPSAEELARAVEQTGARSVVVLPNNKNVVAVAEKVGELVGAEVYVVPTRSIAAGLAAMVGYDPQGEPGGVAGEMDEILSGVRSAEVTVAVRDARVEGRDVREGDALGFLDGGLWAVGPTVAGVASEVAKGLLETGVDVVTLLVGEGLDEAEAGEIAEGIRGLDPEVEVEVKVGGQPVYPLQMVAE